MLLLDPVLRSCPASQARVHCFVVTDCSEIVFLPIHVGFVVHRVALGEVFVQVLQFPRQYHSTGAPYSYIHIF
jgi:hypothetical protein